MSRQIARGEFWNGNKSSIGATALQLTATSVPGLNRGVTVKASRANASGSYVYVGKSSGVTAGSVDATDGFELSPGDSTTVEIDDPSKVYVIGSTTGLRVSWIAS